MCIVLGGSILLSSYFPFQSVPMSVIAVYSLDYGYGGGLRVDGLVLMSQLNLSHVRNLSG